MGDRYISNNVGQVIQTPAIFPGFDLRASENPSGVDMFWQELLIQDVEISISCIENWVIRTTAFQQAAEGSGVMIEDVYWTLDECDGEMTLSCPEEEKLSHS